MRWVGYTELGATTDDGSPVTIDSSLFVDAVGSYIISYDSTDGTNAATTVTRTVNVVDTTTAPADPTDGIPAINSDAEEVEFEGEITSIGTNNYVIDGKTVWITADTVLKINDDVPIVVGLPAQVKGMQNPDGEVVGIKVELN